MASKLSLRPDAPLPPPWPMYDAHRRGPRDESSDWVILSPDVPVFRRDDGRSLATPWSTCFITCAAPYAPTLGQPLAGDFLERRIRRVLAVAQAHLFAREIRP